MDNFKTRILNTCLSLLKIKAVYMNYNGQWLSHTDICEKLDELEQLKAQQPVKCSECIHSFNCEQSINFVENGNVITGEIIESHTISNCSYGKRKEVGTE